MSEKKRSLVEEALLQMKNLEEAVTENAKGILASTMKEEIKELVKESLTEKEEIEEMSNGIKEKSYKKKGHSEMAEQEDEIEVDIDDEDEMEPTMGDMDKETEMGDFEMEDSEMEDSEMGDEVMITDFPSNEFDMEDEDEDTLLPLDLTDSSDEEILKVFKAMGEEDGIIIKKDNNRLSLHDEKEDVEYEIQLESEEEIDMEMFEEEEIDMEMFEEEEIDMEEEEIVYEIEIDDEISEEVEEGQGYDDREDEREGMLHNRMSKKDFKTMKSRRDDSRFERRKEESMETARSNASMRKVPNAKSASETTKKYASDRMRPAVRESKLVYSLKEEVTQLREKNEEYRKALNIFKEKLNEVAVFNSNLAYATRLFTEHTTSKQEKINILKRFDSIETIKESKNLYKSLKEELDSKDTSVVTESVKSKIQKPMSNGSASNLIESKTYENPQFQRMKDLMSKIQK
jgi:hypothetical protein